MNYFDLSLFYARVAELFGGSSHKEIMAKTGLTQPVVSKIKDKKLKAPSIDTIYAISRAYQVNVDWLVGVSPVREIEEVRSERRDACEILGLSDSAVLALQSLKDTKSNAGIDSLLTIHRANKDQGSGSLLESIAKFMETVFDYSINDVELKMDENGQLNIQPLSKERNKKTTIQTNLSFDCSFTLADIILEKQIQEINKWLYFYKENCTHIKNYQRIKRREENEQKT